MSLPPDHKFTPAAERLREHLRSLYSPIKWDFDKRLSDMSATTDSHYSARGLADAANVPLCRVLKMVGQGIIRPSVKLRNSWVFVAADLTTIRQHLSNQTRPNQ